MSSSQFPTDASNTPTKLSRDKEALVIAGMLAGHERRWTEFHSEYARFTVGAIQRVRTKFPSLISLDDVGEIHANMLFQLLKDDMRKLRLFNPEHGTRFEYWLSAVARNCAYDFLRQKRREPRLGWAADETSRFDGIRDPGPDAFRIVAAKEETAVVWEVVAALSTRDREFIALFFEQGLDPIQTAERLGIEVSTVYSKKHKIRARIEGLLEKRLAA